MKKRLLFLALLATVYAFSNSSGPQFSPFVTSVPGDFISVEAFISEGYSHVDVVTAEDEEFPGGRRFHFIEPSGNEFAVWTDC